MYPGDFARQRPDHPAFIMAAERTGLYYTAINSCLGADELAYIVGNSRSKVLITSLAKPPLAREALAQCPGVTLALVADSADAADTADTVRVHV